MLFSQYIQKIKKGSIDSVYLLTGEESFLHHHAQHLMKTALIASDAEAFDLELFDGSEFQYDAFINGIRALPLMSQRRLVIFKRFDKLDSRQIPSVIKELEGDLSKMVILFLYEEKVDFRKKTVLEKMRDRYTWVNLAPQKGAEFERVLKWMLDGKKIDANLTAFLAECGADLWQISGWLEQASDFIGENQPLTLEAMEKFIDLGGYANIWRLTDAVGNRDIKQAQYLLYNLMRNREKPNFIMWGLKDLFIHLDPICKIRQQGGRLDSFAKTTHLHAFRFRKFNEMSVNFTPSETESALAKLEKTDFKLKTSAAEPESLLVELMDDIIGRK